MKFSYQLAYNAFAPWSGSYVEYKKLKKMMKRQRRELKDKSHIPQNWEVFSKELETEIDKVGVFFTETSAKLKTKLDTLCASLAAGRAGANPPHRRWDR